MSAEVLNEEQNGEQSGLSTTIKSMAEMLSNKGVLTSGDIAVLRRMDPRRPDAPFFKVEGLLLEAQLPGEAERRQDLETRWAAIVVGLAQLGDLYRPARRLGLALVDAGFSELRFARLLRADVDRLVDELPLLARFLVAQATPADWTHAAHLILSAGTMHEEKVRRHLARDYYGALARVQED